MNSQDEKRAFELYPVCYQSGVERRHPDKNLPLRRAYLRGCEDARREVEQQVEQHLEQ